MLTAPKSSFRASYSALVSSGTIEADPAQARAVEAIAAFDEAMENYKPVRKLGFLSRLFADKKAAAPNGLYVYGEVGRGKTMLMDLLFQTSRVEQRRRAHFHEFMADTHERIYKFRQQMAAGTIPEADVMQLTAESIFEEAWLLCFDEFHVTDIADAMILGRLFQHLFELGVVVFATSNVAPEDLYKGGLNRALFLPFIDMIQKRMDVMRLDSRTDFRLEKLHGMKTWLVPADATTAQALDDAWLKLTGGVAGEAVDLTVKGRVLRVPQSAQGVARFTFAQLCEVPLGASDYLKLAHDYHTLIIDNVPMMDNADRNAAKRFITLIDALYDNAVKLMASAAAEPHLLYSGTEGYEAMAFQRTVSRLMEMGSESYIALHHGHGDSTASGSSTGLVET